MTRIILASILIIIGLLHIIFYDRIRKVTDMLRKNDPFLWGGDWWTGKYTRSGLVFMKLLTILVGLFLVGLGITLIIKYF